MSPSAHATATVTCTAKQIFVQGAGATEARVKLQFTPSVDGEGQAVLRNFQGSLAFPEYLVTTFAAAGDDIINVKYKITSVKSNPNYRPTKYKDSIQFKDIVATQELPGSAPGLYAIHLIIPKSAYKSSAPFQAVVLADMDQNGARLILNCK